MTTKKVVEDEKNWPSSSPYPEPSAPLPPSSQLLFEYPPTSASTFTTTRTATSTTNQLNTASRPLPWSTGLCNCFDDISSCCLTCFCPCVAFGRIAEIIDRGSTSCGVSGALYTLILCVSGCPCLYSCFYRSKLRGQYFLEESPCIDCCVHCCCEECALCQEYRELKNRGFDMSIGWHGNMERKNREHQTPPDVQGGMTR